MDFVDEDFADKMNDEVDFVKLMQETLKKHEQEQKEQKTTQPLTYTEVCYD